MTSHQPIIVIRIPAGTSRDIAEHTYQQTRARLPDRDILVVSGDIRIEESWPDICGDVMPTLHSATYVSDICRRPPGHHGAHVANPADPDSAWWTSEDD